MSTKKEEIDKIITLTGEYQVIGGATLTDLEFRSVISVTNPSDSTYLIDIIITDNNKKPEDRLGRCTYIVHPGDNPKVHTFKDETGKVFSWKGWCTPIGWPKAMLLKLSSIVRVLATE